MWGSIGVGGGEGGGARDIPPARGEVSLKPRAGRPMSTPDTPSLSRGGHSTLPNPLHPPHPCFPWRLLRDPTLPKPERRWGAGGGRGSWFME